MSKEVWMAWNPVQKYVSSLYGTYNQRDDLENVLKRHNVATFLRPVRVTIHDDEGEQPPTSKTKSRIKHIPMKAK